MVRFYVFFGLIPGKRDGFNLTFPYTFKILNFIFVMVRGSGGGTEKIILFMFYGGGGGGVMKISSILGGGGLESD